MNVEERLEKLEEESEYLDPNSKCVFCKKLTQVGYCQPVVRELVKNAVGMECSEASHINLKHTEEEFEDVIEFISKAIEMPAFDIEKMHYAVCDVDPDRPEEVRALFLDKDTMKFVLYREYSNNVLYDTTNDLLKENKFLQYGPFLNQTKQKNYISKCKNNHSQYR